MKSRFRKGDIIQHFKRETVDKEGYFPDYLYMFLGTVRDTETKQEMALYEALYSNNDGINAGDMFVRPLDMFLSEVDRDKYPNIKQKYRFEVYMSVNDMTTKFNSVVNNSISDVANSMAAMVNLMKRFTGHVDTGVLPNAVVDAHNLT